ncbi:PAS domain S-box protein [Natrinema marinum]|uniref:PAS domain S-box protein n=1 Tax=Natrinema marinum TaxID=2961598 RepID=UPI0020C85DB8|nr:PAS domain S-box protein [Natrinema marinum]
MDSSPEGDAEFQTQMRQQEAVADLGQQALETDDLDRLLSDASAAIAETLDAEYVSVLELCAGGDEALLRQGVGWSDDHVDETTVPVDPESRAGHALRSEDPVVVDDFRTEERFSEPELVSRHDIVSGISVVIGPTTEPWGVLETDTTECRDFTDRDAAFVQNVATVLASAIENRRTQRRFEAVFEDPNILVGLLEPDGTVVDINGTAMEYIDAELADVTGEPFWETPWWGEGDAVQSDVEEWTERAAAGEYVDFEADLVRPRGAHYTISGYFRPVTDDDGEVVSIIVSDRDVTERKERERELELFRTLLDHSTELVLVIDPDTGQFLDANETACRRLGYDRDELLTLSVLDVERKFDETEDWRSHAADAKTESAVTVEGVHERKDGTTYPAEINVTYVELDREYMLAVARDVTERRKRERRLSTLMENVPGMVYRCRNERGWPMEFVSDACREITGYEPAALEDGRINYGADVMVDEDREKVCEAVQRTTDERDSFSVTYRIETADGERRWVRSYGRVLSDGNGDGEILEGIISDITERKRLENELKASNERLEQFAYAASHDLQEPLRMVTSYLQLLEDRYADAFDEDGEEFLAYAIDGAERMREMIDGLLEYSRVDTQGDPFEPVDLEALLEEVLADLRVQIEESEAEITIGRLPRVNGDDSQLRQVLQNLLSNAITYSGDEPPQIHVDADRRGEMWRLSVRDEGIGIDPADQNRVFEVFQRLHSHEEYAGTGIGLALCQRIVQRHGGEIWVDGRSGEGATFSFTLSAVLARDR